MLHRAVTVSENGTARAPACTNRLDGEPISKNRMPEHRCEPDAAYRIIHDEMLLEAVPG